MRNACLAVQLARLISDITITGLSLVGMSINPWLLMVRLALFSAQAVLLVTAHPRGQVANFIRWSPPHQPAALLIDGSYFAA